MASFHVLQPFSQKSALGGYPTMQFAQRTFLLVVSVIEATLALLSLANDELAIVRGPASSTVALCGFFVLTSVVLGHLAFDLSNKALYRVGLWTFLAQLALVTVLQRVAVGEVQVHGLVAASLAAVGVIWFTATYKRNLLLAKETVVAVEEVVAVVVTPRGRSRSPRGGRRTAKKAD